MENVVKQGKNVIKAHLEHLRDHNQTQYFNEAIDFLKEKNMKIPLEEKSVHSSRSHSCPGAAVRTFAASSESSSVEKQTSALRHWPVKLYLVPPNAPFLDNSHLLVAADCVPFANPNFHSQWLHGKSLVIGCPKHDDLEFYRKKLTEIFKNNNIKSVTVAIMGVPCCHGLYAVVEEAIKNSGKNIPLIKEVIGIDGEMK